jgi:hypothetical protein
VAALGFSSSSSSSPDSCFDFRCVFDFLPSLRSCLRCFFDLCLGIVSIPLSVTMGAHPATNQVPRWSRGHLLLRRHVEVFLALHTAYTACSGIVTVELVLTDIAPLGRDAQSAQEIRQVICIVLGR